MVYYASPKRRSKVQRSCDNASITDLADELVLQITGLLEADDLRNLRLTCGKLAGPCLTEIQGRTKVLYIHPSPSHLKAVPEICEHTFSDEVEEIILLGDVPLDDMKKVLKEYRNGKTMKSKFATWPKFFPKNGKAVAHTPDVETKEEERLTHDVLVESICRRKKCKHLSYQTHISKPGFNEVKRSNIETFAKKYLNALWNTEDNRVTDVQLLIDLLTDSEIAFTSLSIRTPLPMAPGILYDNLPHLTTLDLALDIYANPAEVNVYWPQQHKWRQLCTSLLKSAQYLTSLTLVLTATSSPTSVPYVRSHALESVEVFERRWPKLKDLTLRMLPCGWHTAGPERPTCQTLQELEPMKRFLTWHAISSGLNQVDITNILFVSTRLTSITTPSGPPAIETLLDILDILRKGGVRCEYVVNQFRHHQHCRRKQSRDLAGCRMDCGLYTPLSVDLGTTVEDFERLVGEIGRGARRGVEVDFGHGAWSFRWREDVELGELVERIGDSGVGKRV